MRKIEISQKTIIFTVVFTASFLLGLQLLWELRDLIFSLLIAFILMSALKPSVERLELKNFSHGIATALVYLAFVLFFLLLFSVVIPPLIEESTILFINMPALLGQLNPRISDYLQDFSIGAYLPDATSQVFRVITGIFSNTIFVVSTLFFGFYFLLEEKNLTHMINTYADKKNGERIMSILARASLRMSSWFWGQLALMTVVGIFNYIGFSIIGIKYALPLAVLAGLLEVLPTIGPIVASIPAFIVGLSTSYFMGTSALAISFLVQQLENNVIVPIIMKKAVGINPITTLIVLVIGGKLGGVLGLLLAIPAFLFIESIILEYRQTSGSAVKER